MNTLPAVHTAITSAKAMPLAERDITALVAEISAMPYLDETAHSLLAVLRNNHQWFHESNRRQAMKLLRALLTAYRHGFYNQVARYIESLLNLVANDEGAKAEALVFQHLNFRGLSHVIPDDEPLPYDAFTIPIFSPIHKLLSAYIAEPYEFVWEMQRLTDWSHMVPTEALQAIELLDQYQIAPTYWIADKVRVLRYERRSVDPQLVAQFYKRFSGIAMWI